MNEKEIIMNVLVIIVVFYSFGIKEGIIVYLCIFISVWVFYILKNLLTYIFSSLFDALVLVGDKVYNYFLKFKPFK